MKKSLNIFTILVVFILLLSSCASQSLTNRSEEIKTFATDFREYVEKGFLFMPDEYFGEYEVKGMITAELHPEVIYVKGIKNKDSNQVATTFYNNNEMVTKIITLPKIDDLIEHVYNTSIEWGGDAFTHFETDIKTEKTDENQNTTYYYYTISGIVIERKNK